MLSCVDVVAAEDTRVTRHLLAHYGIQAKIVSLREHNEVAQSDRLIELIQAGQSVALVSDAGTPGICDPGAEFVARARAAGVLVVPIPGPSALTCALSVLGWQMEAFAFRGFLPSQSGARRRALASLQSFDGGLVFYEAPHRVEDTLRDMLEVLGAERKCVVFRELTKKFEQVQAGSLSHICEWIAGDENHRRGEFVLAISGRPQIAEGPGVEAGKILSLLCAKLPTGEAVRIAAEITGLKRNELYDLALQQKKGALEGPRTDD